MSIETECKFLNANLQKTASILRELGAVSTGRHYETNLVFDTPDLSLFSQGKLLRLRSQEWPDRTKYLLTFKAPTENNTGNCNLKIRQEQELEIGDIAVMTAIIENLGYRLLARYEKIREQWQFFLNDLSAADAMIHVDLDLLPFCRVVEIEGNADNIDRAAKILGLDKLPTSAKSYHYLHQKWREEHGLEPQTSFVFADAEKDYLRKNLGLK